MIAENLTIRMVTKKNIKEYIDRSYTDILYEKILSLLPDDNEIIYEPKGLFNKGILNDTGKVIRKKGMVYLEINRAGLYDILPKGLFHDKLDDSNNKPEFIERIESERNIIRKLFLPFDSEAFSFKTKIERESLNHFRNTYDSEIAISLMEFYRLLDELDLLSIYEILLLDIIFVKQKKQEAFNVNTYLNKLLSHNTSLYSFTARLIEATDGDSHVLRFLNTIPYAQNYAGSTSDIQNLLSYVLDQRVTIEKVRRTNSYRGIQHNRIGVGSRLNADTTSLLLGNTLTFEEETLVIMVASTSDNMYLNYQSRYGCIGELTKVFLDYFIKFPCEYNIVYDTTASLHGAQNASQFRLKQFNRGRISKLKELRKQVLEKTKYISVSDKVFVSNMQVDLKVLMMKYFSLYQEHIFIDGSNHALLNMNTKI